MVKFIKNGELWQFSRWDGGDSLSMNELYEMAAKTRSSK